MAVFYSDRHTEYTTRMRRIYSFSIYTECDPLLLVCSSTSLSFLSDCWPFRVCWFHHSALHFPIRLLSRFFFALLAYVSVLACIAKLCRNGQRSVIWRWGFSVCMCVGIFVLLCFNFVVAVVSPHFFWVCNWEFLSLPLFSFFFVCSCVVGQAPRQSIVEPVYVSRDRLSTYI